MSIIKEHLNILFFNKLIFFYNSELVFFIYSLVFFMLLLESAILPAVFLPGDSLLIFLGVLIEKGILNFIITLGILTVAVSLGSWIGFLQGRFLENNKVTQRWLAKLPCKSYQRIRYMFNRYGLSMLLVGRFVVFVRTVLPTIAGVSGLSSMYFQLFNWISAFVWVFVLVVLGIFLERIKILSYIASYFFL